MSSRPRRNGTEKSKDSAAEEKNVVELIKGITGASTEDVEFILRECGGNADEATARLVENPSLIFSQVQSKKDKKKKRDEERKSQPAPTTSIDSQRGSYSGRGRGRGRDRGGRGHDRSVDRGSRSYDQPTSVDVSFDPPATSGWGSTANESTGGGWDTVTSEKAGNGWDSVAIEKPAGRWDTVVAGAAGGQSHQSEDTGVRWDTAATNEGSAAGAWDIVDEQPEQSSKTQTLGTQDAGVPPPVNSTQQPIGQPIVKQAAPAPIRPPHTGSTGPRSMADLFKQTPVSGQQKVGPPPIPIPKAAPTAPAPASSAVPAPSAHTPNTPQLANPAGHLDSEDTNGWGPDTADQKIELQGDGLGAGFSGSQKQVQPGSGVIQSGLNPQNAVSRGLPSAPMNQGWQQLEERPSADAWGASHSSAGLGSIGLDPSLHQHQNYLTDPQVLSQSSWMQQQQPSQPQSLGDSILSSLNQSAAPQGSDHLPSLPPTATDLSATSSGFGSNLGQPLAQRLPSNHANQMQFGDFTSQVGNLDLSSEAKQDPIQPSAAAHFASYGQHTLPDLQTGNASSKTSKPGASSLFQPASLSDSSTPQAYGSQGLSQQSQGQQGLRSATHAPVPAHVAQRALDAFNSAGPHLQGPASQKPAGTAAPETSTASSQTLYNQQAYQPGQTYSQYQYTGAQQPYTAYSNYQQEQAQAPTTPQAPAAQKQRGTTSTTSSLSYDPSHFAAYNQQAGQRELSQAAPEFQAQAQKYSGTAQTGGTGSSASHSATALSQQPGLSQMNQSYSNQLNSMPQSFYSGGQQYSFPQYNNYSQGGAGGYGYGHASGYQGQQAVYNHPAASGYSQAGKYGGGYGATGGYQHGGYGAKEKEHQGTHLGHGLYGQQQLPLGRQHYQGAGVQDHSSYAYQAPGQGYGGYGRQYGQQYYNQNQ